MGDKLGAKFGAIRSFLKDGIWDADISSLPLVPSILARFLRVVILMLRGIKDDELPIRASALTFITLVSIVPLLSIALAVSKGLGYGQDVLDNIAKFSQTQPQKVQEMINQIIGLVEQTDFQSLGWIGMAFLVVAATLVLNGLEKTLNQIWGISHSRNMVRRISNYISLLVVGPIFIGLAGTVQGILISGFSDSASLFHNFLLQSMPFVLVSLGLALLYAILPNVKVGFMPALISGLAGGLVWLIWQKAFISLQLSVAKYNAIYGTFAALPIFLVWLHTSWIIILLGAEVAFAVQYHDTLHLERGAQDANMRTRQLLALSIMRENARVFSEGHTFFNKNVFADKRKVPIRLVNGIVEMLVGAGLLVEVSDRSNCYVLGREPGRIEVKQVLDLVEEEGRGIEDIGLDRTEESLRKIIGQARKGIEDALAGRTLRDLEG